METCRKCMGLGKVHGKCKCYSNNQPDCQDCGGTGSIFKTCDVCNGSGGEQNMEMSSEKDMTE